VIIAPRNVGGFSKEQMSTVSQAVIAAAGIALIVAAAVLAYGAKGWFTVSAVAPTETRSAFWLTLSWAAV